MAEPVVLDAGPPSTFARVGRLDLLEARLSGRAVLPGEVAAELKRGAKAYAQLQDVLDAGWIDIREPFDKPADLLLVARTRLAIAGSEADPLKNLGEAAAIVLAQRLGAHISIDDFDGTTMARARGLLIIDTIKLLQHAIAMGEISCSEAVKLYEAMRKVSRLPDRSRRELCS